VPSDAVGGTPASYAEQVLTHSIAMLGRITTIDALVAGWVTHSQAVDAAR
jgi:hypothetical protein